MKSAVYDLEIYRNYFNGIFIDVKTDRKLIQQYIDADIDGDKELMKEVLSKVNHRSFIVKDGNLEQLAEFVDFVDTLGTIFGFNNYNYDDLMLDFIVRSYKKDFELEHLNYNLFDISQQIIEDHIPAYHIRKEKEVLKFYKAPYRSIDLMKLNYLDKRENRVSLKQVGIILKWYKIQDLPIDPHSVISDEQVPKLVYYCINDVLITLELLMYSLDELRIRNEVVKEYDVMVLSDSRSGTGDKLMSKFYSESTGLQFRDYKDRKTYRSIIHFGSFLSTRIHFDTIEMNTLLDKIKSTKYRPGFDKLRFSVIFREAEYIFATGGLHSKDRAGILKSTDKYNFTDADVDSFYPRIMINERICPEHLSMDAFLIILESIVTKRLKYKSEGNHNGADILKIVINSIYGEHPTCRIKIGLIAGIS